jgi:hypothetical protein
VSPEDKFHDLQSLTPSYALLPVSPNSPIPYSGDATTPSSHSNRRRKPVASPIVSRARRQRQRLRSNGLIESAAVLASRTNRFPTRRHFR